MVKITTTIPAPVIQFDILADGIVIATAKKLTRIFNDSIGLSQTCFEVTMNGKVVCFATTGARARNFVEVMMNYQAANIIWHKKSDEYGYKLIAANWIDGWAYVNYFKSGNYFFGNMIVFQDAEIAQEYLAKFATKKKWQLADKIVVNVESQLL